MTAADWAVLVPAVAGLLTAAAAYLKSRTTARALAEHAASHFDTVHPVDG